MNKEALQASELPRSKTKQPQRRVSLIWIVPLVAALIAGYLVYQRVREVGPTITIRFHDVDGLKPGQTPVRYRGADIGQVSSVSLGENHEYATVEVKLRENASSLARAGASFWIVRPQVGMGGLTGLGTIITGPYIEVLPGKGPTATEFTGVEHSPLVLDPDGLKVILLTEHGGSLRAGVPIYYRGIEVGAVQDASLSTNAAAVEIQCVIRRPYAPLVRTESKFWNVTGLDVRVGFFRGAEVNVESLKSLLIGGIAFATPEDAKAGPVADGMIFRLHDEAEKEWTEWSPRIAILESNAGMPVEEVNTSRELSLPQGKAP